MPLPVHEFGRVLLGRAADTLSAVVVVHVELALAEVGQLDLAVGADQHVLRLQIALDDVQLVQVADHDHHLGYLEHGYVFIEPLGLRAGDVKEQFTPGTLVHHETDELAGHEALVKGYDELVPDLL